MHPALTTTGMLLLRVRLFPANSLMIRYTRSALFIKLCWQLAQIIQDIRPAFSSYPDSKFQFIQGLATSISTSSKTITYAPTSTKLPTTQAYDILIIATGSRSASPGPWKTSLNGHEETAKELHEIQAAVKAAKTIAIGGGGASGVETAAELAFEYGLAKEISLVSLTWILTSLCSQEDIN